MGDPMKTKSPAPTTPLIAPQTPEPPMPQAAVAEPEAAAANPAAMPQIPEDAGAMENQAVAQMQANLRRARKGEATVIIPGGQRRAAAPLMNARYTLNQHTKFLSEPESILTDEWLARHRGWKYEWPIGESNETKAYLRAEWFKPVPPEALRKDAAHALVGDALTPQGNAICWMRHILVAVPQEVWRRRHVEPAEYALARTASRPEDDAAVLDEQFADHGFRAEVETSKDVG